MWGLEVSHNPLRSVPSMAFYGLERALWELHLHSNLLTEVPVESVSNLKKLSVLNLRGKFQVPKLGLKELREPIEPFLCCLLMVNSHHPEIFKDGSRRGKKGDLEVGGLLPLSRSKEVLSAKVMSTSPMTPKKMGCRGREPIPTESGGHLNYYVQVLTLLLVHAK